MISWLGMRTPFPPIAAALTEPNGLLAAGGDLSPDRLLAAYRHGIFPWYSRGEPILWWSPDPRMVFHTDQFHVSTKLRRFLRDCDWTIRADTDRARGQQRGQGAGRGWAIRRQRSGRSSS